MPVHCRCSFRLPIESPLPLAIDPVTDRAVGRLIEDLSSPSIETRDEAEGRLRGLGLPAIARLQRILQSPDPEIRARSRSVLEYLWKQEDIQRLTRSALSHENQPDVEITGLALLCFLGTGYTHLSRDELRNPLDPSKPLKYGEIVKRGVHWLIQKAESEGAFDPLSPVADAVATLAVLEAYGMTASEPLKESAERAAGRLARLQREGARFCAWKAMALGSAILGELPGPFESELEQLEKGMAARKEFLFTSAGAILNARRTRVRDSNLSGELLQSTDQAQTPEEVLFATLAIFQAGGAESHAWKTWSPYLADQLHSTRPKFERRCGDGAWEGRSLEEKLKTTAYNLLALAAYYRYTSHFGLCGVPLWDTSGEPH